MPAQALIITSACIVFALGTLHLIYTFFSRKLHPYDPALTKHMQQVTLRITRETTLWRAWIGFNASHSLGAMLFGLVYGELAWAHAPLLFGDPLLLGSGLLFLAALLLLARRYWFRIPLFAIAIALVFYLTGAALPTD
ncbi:hypothetical protein DCO48_22335 [Pseudomonas sp. SDI]|uniref:LIC_13387 family protein n=1 Tax=Pseudomonas sp. SDI TaxID=2170734 RepID=UPI000DE78A44|nr:hypothetical protein [Pseudomonas sp. SDI]PWB29200.1 hypothetical protein DCO48_22335 [Pseudomonas sp. SDI]